MKRVNKNIRPGWTKLKLMVILLGCAVAAKAQNPFVESIYTADPSAHVWSDGRLYVYPSHDIAPPQGCDLMDQYHVFSTDDMVNWTDHGEILRADDVDWGRAEGGFMWAPDCAFKDGTYYFYFPHPSGSGDQWNSTWKIGVATSSEPAANFEVQGYIEGLKSMIDPCVFVDDDGQAYLYYGGGNLCEAGKLKDNMMEIDGQMQQMQGLVDFHEATWVHKYNGMYYLSYSDNNNDGGNQLRYAVSDSPLGPWTYRGVYMKPTGSPTNHGSIVEYKGQWYAFYHNSILSGHPWLRSICVDSLFYNQDGTIQEVTQTREHGTPYLEPAHSIPGTIEMEDYDQGGQGKAYSDSDTSNNGNDYRENEGVDVEMNSPGNYNIGWTTGGEWIEYTVEVTESALYSFELRAASPDGNGKFHLKIDEVNVSGSVVIPSTGGWQNYQSFTVPDIPLKEGTHIIQFFEETGGFNLDKMIVTKSGVLSSGKNIVNSETDIMLFPNPAKGSVSLRFQGISTQDLHLEIRNINGQLVKSFEKQNSSEGIQLDISGISAGTYFLVLRSDRKQLSKKLMVYE
ncbi:Por secretion system C-terminal sorting domain-containing protein [Draconibacterium orientale]|uniref:Glycosyl hydrolase family 43 n=1 Tax=Draconibacterium orientale TaxID=1168034 RepID=X5E1V8_9BACT|nr:family 43 glycosylhydrolase [Draconibacterium orientale]AHW60576.1 glycosyl hydrolase family 43 [Draconibacterium orientale]SET03822.1 Por secretion system C-terminal sorting domain-containing protein [Draconibacterium orientale]